MRQRVLLFCGVVMGGIFLSVRETGEAQSIAGFYGNALVLEFLAGMALGWTIERTRAVWTRLWAVLLALAVIVYASTSGAIRVIHFGIPALCLTAAVILVEPHFRKRISRIGTILGDASYAIYLVHLPTLIFLAALARRGLLPSDGAVGRNFALLLCTLAGVAVHYCYEKPLSRQTRAILDRMVAGFR